MFGLLTGIECMAYRLFFKLTAKNRIRQRARISVKDLTVVEGSPCFWYKDQKGGAHVGI